MSKVKVPTIDLEKAKDDPSQLKLLDIACKDHGFFLLKNHHTVICQSFIQFLRHRLETRCKLNPDKL